MKTKISQDIISRSAWPDYESGIEYSSSTGSGSIVIPEDGYLLYNFYTTTTVISLKINDIVVAYGAASSNAYVEVINDLLPVRKGDVITYKTHALNSTTNFLRFYPLMGKIK